MSSNGRTQDPDSWYGGSSPSAAAIAIMNIFQAERVVEFHWIESHQSGRNRPLAPNFAISKLVWYKVPNPSRPQDVSDSSRWHVSSQADEFESWQVRCNDCGIELKAFIQ